MTFANPPGRRPAIVYAIVPLVLIGLGVAWIVASMKSGKVVVGEGVGIIASTHPADGARNVPVDAPITANLNPGHPVDPDSLSAKAVRLSRTGSRESVPADLSASPSGETVIVMPFDPLEPGAQYTLQVTRQLKDKGGLEILPFTMSFTTGEASSSAKAASRPSLR